MLYGFGGFNEKRGGETGVIWITKSVKQNTKGPMSQCWGRGIALLYVRGQESKSSDKRIQKTKSTEGGINKKKKRNCQRTGFNYQLKECCFHAGLGGFIAHWGQKIL